MKRLLPLLFCLTLLLSGCQTVGQQKLEPLSKEAAIKLAYDALSEAARKQLLDPPQVDVTEYRAEGKHTLWTPDKSVDIKGTPTYRVEFKTTMDGLLGPETVYIDQRTHKILGLDFRY